MISGSNMLGATGGLTVARTLRWMAVAARSVAWQLDSLVAWACGERSVVGC